MKIIGLEYADPEIQALAGNCETCGLPATNFVRDLFEEVTLDNFRNLSAGDLHRFCDEHTRKSRTVEVFEGPTRYLARQSATEQTNK